MTNFTVSQETIATMKGLKPSDRWPLHELWDDASKTYTTDTEEMASIIIRAAKERQGEKRPPTTAGQAMLDRWGVDLSRCRRGSRTTK